MSSTVIWLCAGVLIPASANGTGPTTALPSKPDMPLVCPDPDFLSLLQKERTMQERWRLEVRRLREMNERCLGGFGPLVEEAERCLREVERRVATMERVLRWSGVDPGRILRR